MKTMNNWEFKYLGYIKYLCANLPMELFCISFIENNFFLFVFPYHFSFTLLHYQLWISCYFSE